MAYDSRYIANLVLDRADAEGLTITNLEINKIIYFLHSTYLASFGEPLIEAKIEAWDYGPVIREIYSEFKSFGATEIRARATKLDLDSLKKVPVYEVMSKPDASFLYPIIDKYMRLGATKLVNMSHEKGGPWDLVYNASGRSNPGMEISDDLIQRYFLGQTRH
ncbi:MULTISPECIES: type II toxin-antitoxin system antitoxin SocA domain-containing protein [unclassified Mesorhizobium]|uniref:Panacea domain-containing protein n=1 Tax=unclassified Mesorhizobium TaxID=325217 RepID=UPI00112914C3|nr:MULTISPECIES: type II toxin-antitoxin system antitoxin SocA domain-containing protein [unclassified Mesorhizobium]MCA0024316.1 DUF4065 domain-containing protein [Mesorhizobium sp. B263B1A]TPJ95316.1 DUF4065 domain-containing protein [Mesorhizobium sp. B2-5-12]TPK24920.1 DUF4065 domain-containing protein [Mesorhizobium sp. B2-5-6]